MSDISKIDQLPAAPLITDSEPEFASKASAFVNSLQAFREQANDLADDVNDRKESAADSAIAAAASALAAQDSETAAGAFADAAASAANFVGDWSSLSGPLDVPASVSHIGNVWVLTESVADVTLEEPGVSQLWIEVTQPLARAPKITSPADGAQDTLPLLTIEGSPFAPVYSVDVREFRQVQIIEQGGTFDSPLIDEQISTDDYQFAGDPDTDYQVRIRDKIVDGPFSAFSAVVSFNTAGLFVEQPLITFPTDNATNIRETPTITATAFSVFGDTDTHESSQWVITRVSDSVEVFDSGEDTSNLTSITVPAGILDEGEEVYTVKVRYKGQTFGFSAFSDEITFTTQDVFFDYTDPSNIGVAVNGGFLVGIIDTVAGTIQGDDDYQTGLRYALIVSPKDFEGGRDSSPASGLPTGDLRWDTAQGSGESGCFTRWNGLEATETILDKNNDSRYEVFGFIRELRSEYPVPFDGNSDWYLPAMDELELMYRNLKPNTANNETGAVTTINFPGAQDHGENPSSDPTGAAYTSGDPARTTVTAFQEGNAESIDLERYWSSTDADEDGRAWRQGFTLFNNEGFQGAFSKALFTFSVRPVRRILL